MSDMLKAGPIQLRGTYPVPSGPAAPTHERILCVEHYLDWDSVLAGRPDSGIPHGRKLSIPRWNNTVESARRAGGLSDNEELYISSRTLGGFIWVPRSGRPSMTTLIDQIVGHTGGSVVFKDATGGFKSSSVSPTDVSETKKSKGRPRAAIYELYAVPRALHNLRTDAPGAAARSIHQLFEL